MVNITTACLIDLGEHSVRITFSNKQVIELSKKQYTEFETKIIKELCSTCPLINNLFKRC
jgi:hypothetical protein